MYQIYRIKNNINQKMYVGFTTLSLKKRLSKHIFDSKNGSQTKLHRAIRKYGKNSFEIENLVKDVYNDKEFMLNIMEKVFIKQFDSYKNGYNMTEGGEGASGYWKGIGSMKGRTFSSTHIENLRISLKGKKRTQESCMKMSVAKKGKPWSLARKLAGNKRKGR